MLHWSRRKLKPTARALLALIAALWLVAWAAPCVMAQTQPMMNHASVHCPMHDGVVNLDADDCGPVTAVSCQLPDLQSPLAAAGFGDMTVAPALLTVLPMAIAIPADTAPRRHDFFLPDIPAPPLHIRYLTLLI
ncbi:MAG: hypothetical protein A3E57_05190 [Candidatus Muproteobacteria bacterium RIFCSPHIGHO2_12_FULL_60_33]|uniref:DUF2946 domain-containing protein n=1 Tax=Candidatus Muproteobacteria bacterium RIFCSPLOWO2_01_FULL_60_18 TaxID=1817768 RepID=A0A1F6TZB2_9PROT|nr:MAG: hypothetical protein A3A87_00990 [Candidatus Muproteobacteria bacterium RIFCSPLOWO2_01_FULL_60_18]OGI54067.1 MAG: hypothetical protein A3D32_08775 [Candidatus Muproteobacteria bacterium RIFCSPHIGHO2_02_FULL_60_13]OGI56627.1 MAG: hypothetical protein A3E57_05190 [Candidatus Muproteobacteria bacterium RIFCSPHIGHO2_12_FULL_60_33]